VIPKVDEVQATSPMTLWSWERLDEPNLMGRQGLDVWSLADFRRVV